MDMNTCLTKYRYRCLYIGIFIDMCMYIFISQWKNKESLFWREGEILATSHFVPSKSITDQTRTVSVCAVYQAGMR